MHDSCAQPPGSSMFDSPQDVALSFRRRLGAVRARLTGSSPLALLLAVEETARANFGAKTWRVNLGLEAVGRILDIQGIQLLVSTQRNGIVISSASPFPACLSCSRHQTNTIIRELAQTVVALIEDGQSLRSTESDVTREARAGTSGFVECPNCGWRFKPTDSSAWNGDRHLRCGQRLRIA